MISALFFHNMRGDLVLSRVYKADITRAAAESFRIKALVKKETPTPITLVDMCTFCHIRVDNIYIVAGTTKNANPALIFQFAYALGDVLKAYLGNDLNEMKLKDSFTLVYELLDEVMDNGYPQIVATSQLKEFIKIGNVKFNPKQNEPSTNPNSITQQITGAIDWRQPGKFSYKKNEVYLDVLESVNVLISKTGESLQENAEGRVVMKTALSGMPQCRIGINDQLVVTDPSKSKTNYININDIRMHRSVKLGQFDTDRTIVFVPPDGEFELMRYTISNVNLPFMIHPTVSERGRNRVEYEIKIDAKFSPQLFATDIIVKIPCPPNTSSAKVKCTSGHWQYSPTNACINWKLKRMFGGQSAQLKGEVTLTHLIVDKQWSRPPIGLNFEVRMFTSSGMKIRYLKVTEEKLGYRATKWVRYITTGGDYQFRI